MRLHVARRQVVTLPLGLAAEQSEMQRHWPGLVSLLMALAAHRRREAGLALSQ